MVAGPVQSFSRDNIKARWTERYTSDAVNKKFVGIPRGCYLGFVPSPTGLILSLKPDKSIAYSAPSGVFVEGETLTGGTSGATAVVRVVSLNYILIDTIVGGPFAVGETISTGSGSASVEHFGEEGVSLARVVSSSSLAAGRSEHMIDVITSDTVDLNFTGFADGVYYVILTASYEVGQTTIGNIVTRTTPPPTGPQEVLICVATKVGVGLTVSATTPLTRHDPHAFVGTRIGFMPGGSIESLQQAIIATDEIVAARQFSDGTTAPAFNPVSPQTTGVPFRLNTDLGNVAMGGRLGKVASAIGGNQFTLAGPASQANVSGSFSTRNRDVEPFRDLSPATGIGLPTGIVPAIKAGGSEAVQLTLSGIVGSFAVGLPVIGSSSGATAIIKTVDGTGTVLTVGDFVGTPFIGEVITQTAPPATGTIAPGGIDLLEGAITGLTGTTTGSNVCVVIDTATGRKAIDSSGNPIFGRLVFDPTGGLSNSGDYDLSTSGGLLNFTASTTTVVVSSAPGTVTTPDMIAVGDLIEGDDGRFYEVASIAGSPNVTSFNVPVSKPYVGPTQVNVASRRRRRFLLEFKIVSSGVESAATLAAGTYKFFFPAWFTLEKSNLDATLQMLAPGDTSVPQASSSLAGVALAAPGHVSSPAALIGAIQTATSGGGGPIGNGNFHTINFSAGASQSAPGVLDVALSAGASGPAGPTGPTGPTGPIGPGFSSIEPFQSKVLATAGLPASGTIGYTFSGAVRGFNTQTSLLNTGAFGPGQYEISNITVSTNTVNVSWSGVANFSLSIGVTAFI